MKWKEEFPTTVQIEVRNTHRNIRFTYRLIDGIPQSFQSHFHFVGTAAKRNQPTVSYV